MRVAICNELFQDWSWHEVCEYAANIGYQGIEIAPFTLGECPVKATSAQRANWRRTAAASGVQIVGLHWLLAKTSGLHVTSDDTTTRRRTAEYLVGLAHLCADLGGSVLVFGSPAQRQVPDGVPRATAMDRALAVFDACLPTLEQLNVTMAIEPLGPEETNFINTASEAIQLVRQLDAPQVRLHLDVKAMSTESLSYRDIIWQGRHQLVHFHANDPNRLGPGMGAVDYAEILPALREVDYQGWLSVEVFDFSPGPRVIAEKSLSYLRRQMSLLA